MFEYEEVSEDEGELLSKELGAIFQTITAKGNNGSIDLLFRNIGKAFLNSNQIKKPKYKEKGLQLVKTQGTSITRKKKGCC